MYKKLLKLLDRNRNKKLDWYEVLFPTPDINKNEKGLRTLTNDQIVEFEVEDSNRGLRAINVTPL